MVRDFGFFAIGDREAGVREVGGVDGEDLSRAEGWVGGKKGAGL
jgi:hypothetical protein